MKATVTVNFDGQINKYIEEEMIKRYIGYDLIEDITWEDEVTVADEDKTVTAENYLSGGEEPMKDAGAMVSQQYMEPEYDEESMREKLHEREYIEVE